METNLPSRVPITNRYRRRFNSCTITFVGRLKPLAFHQLLPDVVWVLGLQVLHQGPDGGSELEASSWRPLQVDFGWVAFREQLSDEAVFGLEHGL